MSRPLFGDEGRELLSTLASRDSDLFPATVRPRFLGLLWLVLVALGGVAAVLVSIAGTLR